MSVDVKPWEDAPFNYWKEYRSFLQFFLIFFLIDWGTSLIYMSTNPLWTEGNILYNYFGYFGIIIAFAYLSVLSLAIVKTFKFKPVREVIYWVILIVYFVLIPNNLYYWVIL